MRLLRIDSGLRSSLLWHPSISWPKVGPGTSAGALGLGSLSFPNDRKDWAHPWAPRSDLSFCCCVFTVLGLLCPPNSDQDLEPCTEVPSEGAPGLSPQLPSHIGVPSWAGTPSLALATPRVLSPACGAQGQFPASGSLHVLWPGLAGWGDLRMRCPFSPVCLRVVLTPTQAPSLGAPTQPASPAPWGRLTEPQFPLLPLGLPLSGPGRLVSSSSTPLGTGPTC